MKVDHRVSPNNFYSALLVAGCVAGAVFVLVNRRFWEPTPIVALIVMGSPYLLMGVNQFWFNYVDVSPPSVIRVNLFGTRRQRFPLDSVSKVVLGIEQNWFGVKNKFVSLELVNGVHSTLVPIRNYWRFPGWTHTSVVRVVQLLSNAGLPIDERLVTELRLA